jgi:hypothetical protein
LVKVFIACCSKNVIDLKFGQAASIINEVFEALLEILKPINTKINDGVLVELEGLEVFHASNYDHQVIVVGLEVLLIQDLESQSMDIGSHQINVLVEKLEILMLGQILKHLLETELKEEIPPSEALRVVLNNRRFTDFSYEFPIETLTNVSSQLIVLVLDVSKVLDINVVIVRPESIVSRSWLFSCSNIRVDLSDPGELLKHGILPEGVLSSKELFLFFIIVGEGLDFFIQEGKSLVGEGR